MLSLALLAGCAGGLVGDIFRPDIYTVRSGDTLHSIAWRYQRSVEDIARWNNLDSPDTIFVGQRLRLSPPSGEPGRSERTVASQQPSRTSPADSTERPAAASRPAASEPASSGRHDGTGPPGEWHWPTRGEVIGTFDNGAVSGRGIDIRGEHGQPVVAAADGDVVYSGTGLQAYGPLIIIRHSRDYLSAYAHNDRLLVEEGDEVRAGEKIAEMGYTPSEDQVLLHFEIRHNGQPVDPLQYLPPRSD